MTQALYAHMNNKTIKKPKKPSNLNMYEERSLVKVTTWNIKQQVIPLHRATECNIWTLHLVSGIEFQKLLEFLE
jgi:hypothetical protein